MSEDDPDPVAGQLQAESNAAENERLREEVRQLRAKLTDLVKWAAELELDPGTDCPLHGEYSETKPCPPPPYCLWQWILNMNFRVTCRPDLPWELEHPEKRPRAKVGE